MKIQQITEQKVESSWIKDLTITGKHATMSLLNNKAYQILDIEEEKFEQWINSPSKGNFYTNEIKDSYKINRIA